MQLTRRRSLGIACLVAAAGLAAFAYRLSWRAGCAFDGKTGTGSLEVADPLLTASWWAVGAALLLFVSAVPVGWARSRESAAAIAVVGLVVAAPLLFLLMWLAETGGVQTCAP